MFLPDHISVVDHPEEAGVVERVVSPHLGQIHLRHSLQLQLDRRACHLARLTDLPHLYGRRVGLELGKNTGVHLFARCAELAHKALNVSTGSIVLLKLLGAQPDLLAQLLGAAAAVAARPAGLVQGNNPVSALILLQQLAQLEGEAALGQVLAQPVNKVQNSVAAGWLSDINYIHRLTYRSVNITTGNGPFIWLSGKWVIPCLLIFKHTGSEVWICI